MPAIIRSLLLSGNALNVEINARKSAAPKIYIPMVTIGRSGLCLIMANCSNVPY